MSRLVTDEQLERYRLLEIHEVTKASEIRVQRILRLMDKAHKVGVAHKLKDKLSKEPCEICKALEALK